MINRTIKNWAFDRKFLHSRMSFICGPRQIGKTTTVKDYMHQIGEEKNYYNWDSLVLKEKFSQNPVFFTEQLLLHSSKIYTVAFDEIHKYPKWKDILKSYYDDFREKIQFIITGSARLDLFRQSGDSLVGRYFLYKMYPLSPHDLVGKKSRYEFYSQWNLSKNLEEIPVTSHEFKESIDILLNLTGYPEPFIDGSKNFYLRWKNEHISLIIHEDLRDLTRILQIQKLETLMFLLPERVGSPLSLNNLARLLQCSHESVRNWLFALEKVYLIFSLSPFSRQIARSVLKEKKYYFWDWGIVDEPGKRLENFLAVNLKRIISTWNEHGLGNYQLYYIRTRDKKEVDFAVVDNNQVVMLAESKLSDKNVSSAFINLKEQMNNPISFQIINQPGYFKNDPSGIMILGLDRFLSLMP